MKPPKHPFPEMREDVSDAVKPEVPEVPVRPVFDSCCVHCVGDKWCGYSDYGLAGMKLVHRGEYDSKWLWDCMRCKDVATLTEAVREMHESGSCPCWDQWDGDVRRIIEPCAPCALIGVEKS